MLNWGWGGVVKRLKEETPDEFFLSLPWSKVLYVSSIVIYRVHII